MQEYGNMKTIAAALLAAACFSLSACASEMGKHGNGDDPDDHPQKAQTEIPVKVCPPGVQKATGADFAILGTLPKSKDGAITFEICVPEDSEHPGKPKISACINGGGGGANDCSKEGGRDLIFKRLLEFPMVQLQGSTCVLLCAPPGATLAGFSAQCASSCK